MKSAVLQVYKRIATPATVNIENVNEVLAAFEGGVTVHAGDDVTSAQLVALVDSVPSLKPIVNVFTGGDNSPAIVASAVEFVLEGLHLSKRLNKDSSGPRATYRSKA